MRPQQWMLSFGLAVLLEIVLLLALGWKAAWTPVSVTAEAEAGDGDDMSMALLASGPLRTARFAPAASPPPALAAIPKPVKPVAEPVPAIPAARPVEPVITAAPVTAPLVRETSPAAAERVAVAPAAPVTAPTVADAGGSGSAAGQDSSTGAAGGSGRADASAGVVAGSSQGSGSGIGSRHARHPYFGKLKTWLNAHKTYPATLKKEKKQGTVLLTFTISRSGELLSSRIVTGSGESLLDQAALDMLQRSSPMPPLPDDLGLDQLTLTIPVEYSLITR